MTRQERQQQQVASALSRGHLARTVVLAREHLAEFPDDLDVQAAAAEAARRAGWEWSPPA